jgi:hypothetical protein
MSYVIERAVAQRRSELLRDAQRERVARVYPGQRHLSLRRPLGRFLVRLGSRLGSAPRREARLAGSAGNVA